MPKITSLWPDGTIIQASDWHGLEQEVRGRQWHKYGTNEFRREMRRRAQLWANVTIPVSSAERMFRALEGAGMVRLDVDEEGGGDDGDDSAR